MPQQLYVLLVSMLAKSTCMTMLYSITSIKLLWMCKHWAATTAGVFSPQQGGVVWKQGGFSSQQFFTAKWFRQRMCIGGSARNSSAMSRFSSCCVSQRSNRNSREAHGVIKPRKHNLSHQHNLKKTPHKKALQNPYLRIKLLSKALTRQRL